MAYTAVKIGGDTKEYQAAMKQLAAQMKEVRSEFSLSAAQAELYGNKNDALKSKISNATTQIDLQKKSVDVNRQQMENLTNKLADQQKKQETLKGKIEAATAAYEESCEKTGKNSEESKALKQELDKLEAQYQANERAIDNTSVAIQNQQTKINNSERSIVEYQAELKRLNQELASHKFKEFGEAATAAGQKIEAVGQKMMVVTGLVTGVATASVKTAADFQSQMSKVQAISGATSEDMEKMSDSAKYWGANSKFSATEAASAFEFMALAGWKTEESVSAMEGILNLAAATDMELANASDVVTDYLSAFSMEAKEATTVADLMTYAQGNSNTSAAQLAEAYKNCAANANAMGYDIQQTTGLLGIMANQGLKGSEAGTALTAVFRDMTAKMKDGAIQIGKTNVQVVDANGNYRSMTDILKDVESATDGMGDAQKNAALMSTFTSDSIKGLNLLLNAGADEVESFTSELYDCEGAAKETAAIMQDNLNGQITSLKSKIEGVAITIGEMLIPYVSKMVGWISSAVDAFANLDEGQQKTIVKIAAVVAAIGPALIALAKMVTFIGTVSTGFGTLMEKLAGTKAALAAAQTGTTGLSSVLAALTSPIALVIAAAAALVAGLVYVAATNEDVQKSLKQVASTFTENLKPAITFITETVLPDLKAAWQSLMQMLEPLKEFIVNALTSAWQDILIPALQFIAGTVLPNVITTFQNLWNNVLVPLGTFIGSVLSPIFSALAAVLTALWNNVVVPLAQVIGSVFVQAWDALHAIINQTVIPIMNTVIGVLQNLWNNVLVPLGTFLTATFKPTFDTVFTAINTIFQNLQTVFSGFITFIKGVFTADFKTAWEGIKTFFSGVWELMKSIVSGALEIIKSALSAAWTAIKTVLEPVWNGIATFFNTVWNAIKTTITTVANAIKTTLTTVWNAIKTTVTTVWNAIKTTITTVVNAIKTTITTVWNAIKTTVTTVVNAIKTTITTVWNAIKTTITTVANAIKTTLTTVWNAIKTTVTTVVNAIKTTITTVWNAIKTTITTVVNAIKTTVTTVFNAVKTTATTVFNAVKTAATTAWNGVKTAITTPINAAKTALSTALNGMKSTASSVFNGIKSAASSTWNSIKTAITTPINSAKTAVGNAISAIRSKFNFSWSLPHLKMPHPSISGSFSLNPPSVPHFSISWYKNGAIMDGATIFGMNGNTLLGGGEAGQEAILPLAEFYIRLESLLDEKLAKMMGQTVTYVYVTNVLDGDEIAAKTESRVESKLASELLRRR